MAQLVIPETIDTTSTDGNCVYAAAALYGTPIASPNITIGGQQARFYTSSTPPATVVGTKVNPLIPLPCQIGNRVIVPSNNTTVFFNNQLPAVAGDKAQLFGTDRPLVGPFGPSTVLIGSSGWLWYNMKVNWGYYGKSKSRTEWSADDRVYSQEHPSGYGEEYEVCCY